MAKDDLLIRIAADISSLDRDINKAIGKINRFAGDLSNVGAKLTAAVSLPLAGLGLLSIKTAGDLDSLKRALTAVTGSADLASDQFESLKEVAKLPGLGFKEAVLGAVNLQAAGFSARQAERSLLVFGNALASVGRGKADLDGVIVQLQQMSGKSKVLAEDIKPLIQRVPQLATVMKSLWGTIDTEQLQKMGVGAQEFIEKVTTELEKLPKVTGGIKNALENLGDSTDRTLAAIGNNLTPFVERFVSDFAEPTLKKIEEVAVEFGKLHPAIQGATLGLAGFAVAAPPVIWGLGQIIVGMTTGYSAIVKLSGSLTGGAGLISALGSVAVYAVAAIAAFEMGKLIYDFGKFASESIAFTKYVRAAVDSLKLLADAIINLPGLKTVKIVVERVEKAASAAATIATNINPFAVSRDVLGLGGLSDDFKDLQNTILPGLQAKSRQAFSGMTEDAEQWEARTSASMKAAAAAAKKASEVAAQALAQAESALGVSRDDTSKAGAAYNYLVQAWEAGRIKVGVLANAYAELQKRLIESGQILPAQVTPAWLAMGRAQDIAREAAKKAVEIISGLVPKVQSATLEIDLLGRGTYGAALATNTLSKELEHFTGKFPKLEQSVVDMNKAIKGSVLETSAIMRSMGLKSTADLRVEANKLGDEYERLIKLNRENKASTLDVKAAYEAWSDAERRAAGISVGVSQQRKKALQEVSTILTDLGRGVANAAFGIFDTSENRKLDQQTSELKASLEERKAAHIQTTEDALAAIGKIRGNGAKALTAEQAAEIDSIKKNLAKATAAYEAYKQEHLVKLQTIEAAHTNVWQRIGAATNKVLVDIGKSIVRNIIENLLASHKVVEKVTGALVGLAGKLGGLFGAGSSGAGAVGDIAGGSASAAGDIYRSVAGGSEAVGGVASAAGGIGSAASGAGGAAGQAASLGISGITNLVTGAVSAVSGVIGNFQFMAMNKSLDLIEKSTRYGEIHLFHLLNKANDWWPKSSHLVDIWGAVNNVEHAIGNLAFAGAGGDTYTFQPGSIVINGDSKLSKQNVREAMTMAVKDLKLNKGMKS